MLKRADPRKLEITDLPYEILLETIEYLPLRDRKIARLVCKNWFEVCNTSSFLSNEVLTCIGVYQLSHIYELLRETKRQFLNLRFHHVTFHNIEDSFWEDNGHKIRSIYFIDCEFNCSILEKIVVFCEHMLDLSFTFSSQYNQVFLSLGAAFESLSQKTIIRENLKSLEIDIVESKLICNNDVHNIFYVYPKVKELKISCTVVDVFFEEINFCLSELTSVNKFTISPILNYLLVSANQIEKLKLHFPTNEFSVNFINRLFETLSTMKKLTELSVNMRGVPQLESLVPSQQLKSLEYCLKMNCSLEDFLLQLLHSNPSLQFLKLSFFNILKVSRILFEELMSSNLKSLCVDSPVVFGSDFSSPQKSTPNMTLFSLSIYTKYELWFLHYFRNLRHLELFYIYYDGLKFILEYQTRLKTLILHNCIVCTLDHGTLITDINHGENDIDHSFRRLQNLECLELLSYSAGEMFLADMSSSSTIFSNLKYLRISLNEQSYLGHFVRTMDQMPVLESLFICYEHCTTFNNWIEMCLKLNQLRYLYVKGGIGEIPLLDPNYHLLFVICPSLRTLVHDSSSGQILASYFLNTITNEVYLKQEDYMYPYCCPKIGNFVVHWMNF